VDVLAVDDDDVLACPEAAEVVERARGDGVAVAFQCGVDGRIEGVEDDHRSFAARIQVPEQVLEQLVALRG
jgi:hypothetical protein